LGLCRAVRAHRTDPDAYLPTGLAYSIIANRISYVLDLTGPSVVNDTACASSLIAVEQAVRALRDGTCDAALAGGVNLAWSPNHFIAFSKNGMLSRSGRSRAFDAAADGYVRGEGGAILLLQPLQRALDEGRAIHAVIKAVGSNHGGRTGGLTVTSPDAQARLVRDVHLAGGIHPASVGYIEAHGTGTPVGDPLEAMGLKKAFAELSAAFGDDLRPASCGLGSVKTNIGHLEGAAGVAGIVKVIAAMRHRTLPPNVGFERPNPMLKLEDSPFFVVDAPRPWRAKGKAPLRAGVSAFGFGGGNAHLCWNRRPGPGKRPPAGTGRCCCRCRRATPTGCVASAAIWRRGWRRGTRRWT
jgi:polyketide synthase PksL